MQIVDLKTEGAGLHGVARLTFKVESENIFVSIKHARSGCA